MRIFLFCLPEPAVKVVHKLGLHVQCIAWIASMRVNLAKMASNTVARVAPCFPSIRQRFLSNKKINLKIVTRTICALSRCSFSNAASQVKEVETAAERDREKSKIPIISEFENRNPRNPEYFGYNKPRGYSTQTYRVDFYNK